MPDVPTFDHERSFIEAGYRRIAGIDEAGRGPLAGPVVAAAVVLSMDAQLPWLDGVRDSKQLSARQREDAAVYIRSEALAVGVGIVDTATIDTIGIGVATKRAWLLALDSLAVSPDFVLVDGREWLPSLVPHLPIIDGDALCFSIAAASIIAKVTRDRIMIEMDGPYPMWGFGRHKGYSTPEHLALLERHQPTPLHRRSFAPVREAFLRVDLPLTTHLTSDGA